MNSLTSSLLITLLTTSTLISASMDCKDGKCHATLSVPEKQTEKQTEKQFLAVTTIHYKIQQDEDFLPLEFEENNIEKDREFYPPLPFEDQMESDTDSVITEIITEEPIHEEVQVEDIVVVMGEIEYVCEEERSVICDIDTKICECA